MISRLLTDILQSIVMDWISLKTIGVLDCSYCSSQSRQTLLFFFKSFECILICDNILLFKSVPFMYWISSRQLKLVSIKLSKLSFPKLCCAETDFDVSKTIDITISNIDFGFDVVVKMLNQTTRLEKLKITQCPSIETEIWNKLEGLVLLKLTSFVMHMNANKLTTWQKIFDLIVPLCINTVSLTLSGRGLEQVGDITLIKCIESMQKLKELLLGRSVGGAVLCNIAQRTPKLHHLKCYMMDSAKSESWLCAANLFKLPIVTGTVILSPLIYESNTRSLSINEHLSFVSQARHVPHCFFTISMNLLSLSLSGQFILLPEVLTKIIQFNSNIGHLSIACKCDQVTSEVLSCFLSSMMSLEILYFKSLSHFTAHELTSLFCNLTNKVLREIHVNFSVALTPLQVSRIIYVNPQIEIFDIKSSNSSKYKKTRLKMV